MNENQARTLLTSSLLEGIRLSDVEEFIGEGLNHVVFKYKCTKVLKIPKKKGSLTYSNSDLLQNDLFLIKTYFPGLSANTKIIENNKKDQYVIVQDFCKGGTEISGEKIDLVRTQLETIIAQNKELYKKTGHSLDLFGSAGFINSLLAIIIPGVKPQLSNILMKKVKESYTVSLVDIELLRLDASSQKWTGIPHRVQSWISYKLTSFLLRKSFNFSV